MDFAQNIHISDHAAVLISPCILAPGLQAAYGERLKVHWGWSFVEVISRYNLDIITLPCAESMFQGYEKGLKRKKHGIDYYLAQEGYGAHCRLLADQMAMQIFEMKAGGYEFLALLGIEHSPNCAINYMYTHHGMQKRSGLFIEALNQRLGELNIPITQIGINRRYPQKALNDLEQLISGYIG